MERSIERIKAAKNIDDLVNEFIVFQLFFSKFVIAVAIEFLAILLFLFRLEYKKEIDAFVGSLFFYIAFPVRGVYELFLKADTNGKLAFIGSLLGSTVLSTIVLWLLNHFWIKKK